MSPKQTSAYLMMALAMVTVGSTIVASKMMAEMPVFIAAFLRFLIASPLLLGLVWIRGKRLPPLAWRDWATFAAQAGLGSVGYSVLLMQGLARTQASDASVIAGTLPAVAAILSFVVLRERLHRWTIAGIALATLGVVVLSFKEVGAAGDGAQRWAGNALVFAAIVCEAVFLLLNKTIRTQIDPVIVATLMSVMSLLFCALPALVQFAQPEGTALPLRAVGATLYYALVPTVLGFYLWYQGSARPTGAEAALFTAVYPVAGLLLSAWVLGESTGPQHWVGAAFAVAGIVLGARSAAHD